VNDDELLRGLAAAARKEDRELAELEAEPVDARTIEEAVSHLRQGLGGPSSRIVPRARAPRRAVFAAGSGLAAAAAVALWLAWDTTHRQHALPEYTIALLAGGAEPQRSSAPPEATGVIHVRPGAALDVVARPATRVSVPIEARALLMRGRLATPWEAAVEITPEGSARLHGVVPDGAVVPTETCSLVVVVGPAGTLPSDPAELAREANGVPAHAWQVARVTLVAQSSP
jgi:hypothetical protein